MKRRDFDVIVVGGGGAGLAAAIEAAEAGLSVVLLEKNAELGGSTAWSIGSVTATQTPHQRAKRIEDSPFQHWEDMPGFADGLADRDNDDLRKILCDEMPATFQWLLDSGVRFMGPMPEPPHRHPRMHNVLPNSKSFIYHLERRAKRAGVHIVVESHVEKLVVKGDHVTGVVLTLKGDAITVHGSRGVILAAGDFTNSPELKRRFMGEREAKVEAVNMTATGDGQRMAEQLGAQVINGDLALGPELRFIAPEKETLVRRLPPWRALAAFMQWSMDYMPQAILRPFLMKFLTTALAPSLTLFEAGAVLVNRDGQPVRGDASELAYLLAEQPDKLGWIVFEQNVAEQFSAWPNFISTAPGVAYAYLADYKKNRRDIYAEADSVKGLATKLGMNSDALQLAFPGAAGSSSAAKRFFSLGPVRSVFVHSEGGLSVDHRHRVLDGSNRPISGLYAVGSTGQGGLLLKGHGHHLAWAFASGRRAGRFVANLTV